MANFSTLLEEGTTKHWAYETNPRNKSRLQHAEKFIIRVAFPSFQRHPGPTASKQASKRTRIFTATFPFIDLSLGQVTGTNKAHAGDQQRGRAFIVIFFLYVLLSVFLFVTFAKQKWRALHGADVFS